MTTATKPKALRPKAAQSPLKVLEEREAEVAALADEARALGRKTKETTDQFRALHDERQRLAVREPGLFDHTGQPNPKVKDNRVAEIDKALGLLPDINDLAAQYEHGKKLQARAEQGMADFIAARSEELAQALAPLADDMQADAQTKLDEAENAVASYIQFVMRWERLTGRRSPALDGASDIRRFLDRAGLSPVS